MTTIEEKLEEHTEIRWNKTPYTYREYCQLGIIIILMTALILSFYAERKTIESYQKPYNECMKSLNAAERGILPLWDGTGENQRVSNINLSLTRK